MGFSLRQNLTFKVLIQALFEVVAMLFGAGLRSVITDNYATRRIWQIL